MKGKEAVKNVALLMGGNSPEREISLKSGKNVARVLKEAGFKVIEIDVDENVADDLRKQSVDVAFLVLHGPNGEDGTLQGMLEFMGIPYTGSGVLASALANHKIMAKKIFREAGLPVSPGFEMKSGELAAEKELKVVNCKMKLSALTYPVVVKPATVGSSIGLTIVREENVMLQALEDAFKYDAEVLVEKYVPGKEITIGILGGVNPFALPVVEIIPEGEFYNYETKYVPGMSTHIIPARLPEPVYKKSQELALEAHNVLGCYGMSRVDIIVADDGSFTLLEINTIPGMTDTSLLPEAAKAMGISFQELVSKQVEWALERFKKNKHFVRR